MIPTNEKRRPLPHGRAGANLSHVTAGQRRIYQSSRLNIAPLARAVNHQGADNAET